MLRDKVEHRSDGTAEPLLDADGGGKGAHVGVARSCGHELESFGQRRAVRRIGKHARHLFAKRILHMGSGRAQRSLERERAANVGRNLRQNAGELLGKQLLPTFAQQAKTRARRPEHGRSCARSHHYLAGQRRGYRERDERERGKLDDPADGGTLAARLVKQSRQPGKPNYLPLGCSRFARLVQISIVKPTTSLRCAGLPHERIRPQGNRNAGDQ